MHFKLDENIPLRLERFLKTMNYSVSTVFSENISGINDTDLLSLCTKEDFILVTLDKDFVNLSSVQAHAGIIILRLRSQGIRAVIDAFERIVEKIPLQRAKNHVVIVEEHSIKIRR